VDEFQWRGLLVQERQLRDLAYRQRKPEILRDWWASVADILHEYVRSIAEGRPHPPPVEIIGTCANFSGYIAVGQLPDPIKDAVKTAGRRRPGPAESRDIGFAVAYCRAACGGIEHQGKMITIDDPKPAVTTANEFEVAIDTVEKWLKNHEPSYLGHVSISGRVLRDLMCKAGRSYRSAGRSHAAIKARNAKRK
jgi:hypothetical protein